MIQTQLEWNEKYSVKVKLIDDQHKKMFDTINKLIKILAESPTKEQVDEIITSLVQYKKFHFITEERYFNEFNYINKEEHTAKHRDFNSKLERFTKESSGDSIVLAFKLIDFLEDWLLDHLMTEDQKYVTCFQEHGLA